MNLKTLLASAVLATSTLFASSASAQYGGSAIGVNFGGGYSTTKVDTPQGTYRVSNSYIGGGIGVNAASGYGGGYGGYGYGGGYGGYGSPVGYGCVPVYSPFTRCYGAPVYPAVVVPYYGGCAVPVYPVCGGQFIVR